VAKIVVCSGGLKNSRQAICSDTKLARIISPKQQKILQKNHP
jgi:hypothetical protein